MGQELFKSNCKQCHAINQRVVGPALAKVTERGTVEWLIKFIKFPQKTIARGDKYAVAPYKKYNQFMPNHEFMTDAEIKTILSYLTYQSQYVYLPWHCYSNENKMLRVLEFSNLPNATQQINLCKPARHCSSKSKMINSSSTFIN